MKRLAIFLVLSLLLIAGSTSSVLAQENTQETENYIIVYDESHHQFFTSDLMSTALSGLNDSFDTSEVDVNIELIVQNDSFSTTNLQGVDLVLISNPGTDENGDLPEIEDTETQALRNMVNIGGSVFYLSNPLSYNENITGHAEPLNDLLFTGIQAEIEASVSGDTDSTTVIVDKFNNYQNDTFVKLNSDQFNSDTIKTEVNDIRKETGASFLYYGAQIREDTNSPGPIAASAPNTAFVYDNEFSVSFYQESPRWLFGTDIGSEGGRIMLSGSTIMFSDYSFNGTTTWIEQFNNQELFENLIGWLLGITPLPDDQSIVEEKFNPFFISQNLLFATLLGVALFVTTTAYFVYQGRLSPANLFDIFTKKDSSSSSSSSKSEKKKKKSSSSTRNRRRRT